MQPANTPNGMPDHMADGSGHTAMLSPGSIQSLLWLSQCSQTTRRQPTNLLQCSMSKSTAAKMCLYVSTHVSSFKDRHAVLDHAPAMDNQQLWLVYARCDFQNKQNTAVGYCCLVELAAICYFLCIHHEHVERDKRLISEGKRCL